jgi:hypothetical protein
MQALCMTKRILSMSDDVYTFKKRNRFNPVEMLNETVKLGYDYADNKSAYELLKDTESSLESTIFAELKKTENSTSAKALIKKDKRIEERQKEKNKALNKYTKSQILYEAKKKLDDLEQTDEVNKRHEMKMSRYQT